MERSFQEKSKLDSLLRVISLDVFALHRRFAIPSLHRSIPVAVRFTPGNQLRFLSALLLGLLIATLLLSLTRRLNSDEFQLGILALEMNRGRALYSELWDNHGPSPAWLMAGVFQVWPFEDYRQWIGLRLGAFLLSLVSAGFVWLSLCRLYRSKRLQLLGLLVYLAHPAVISVGYEVRSDLLLMVFWTAAVFVWVSWNTGKKERSIWGEVFSGALSAVLLGLCFSTSLKSVFLCGALGLASLILTLKRPQHGWVFVGYAVGGVVGLLLWLAPLWWNDTLPHFWEQFVGKNIDRPSPPIFTGLSELFEWAPLSAFLLLSFSLLGFRLIPGTNSRSQLVLSLWAVMLVLAGAFCFVLPTHHL
ncbi:MAG: glycosyltransferase family 39 protein, partial [Candidatus Sumerlaeia bacterium]|nr:glycosyltransferase family 39 protein [Candidatus Sumerlaeia bacterium]